MTELEKTKIEKKTWQVSKLRQQAEVALLLDNSGSMSSYCGADNDKNRKIDTLRVLAEKFQLRKFVFNSIVEERWDIPEPTGSTDLANAFDFMKLKGIKKVVLITDGVPNSYEEALNSSEGLEIDIYFVGDPPAPDFLKDLAKRSGGVFKSTELLMSGVKDMEAEITALIEGRVEDVISY